MPKIVKTQEIFAESLDVGDTFAYTGMLATVEAVEHEGDLVRLITVHSSVGGMVTRAKECFTASTPVTVVYL